MAQALHAALAFAYRHPDKFKPWMQDSEYIVVLNIENEARLLDLIEQANESGIDHAYFRESDLGGEFTAAAFQPGLESKMLCARLPLALRALSSTAEQSPLNRPVAGSTPVGRSHKQRTETVDLGDQPGPDVSPRYATTQKGSGGSR